MFHPSLRCTAKYRLVLTLTLLVLNILPLFSVPTSNGQSADSTQLMDAADLTFDYPSYALSESNSPSIDSLSTVDNYDLLDTASDDSTFCSSSERRRLQRRQQFMSHDLTLLGQPTNAEHLRNDLDIWNRRLNRNAVKTNSADEGDDDEFDPINSVESGSDAVADSAMDINEALRRIQALQLGGLLDGRCHEWNAFRNSPIIPVFRERKMQVWRSPKLQGFIRNPNYQRQQRAQRPGLHVGRSQTLVINQRPDGQVQQIFFRPSNKANRVRNVKPRQMQY